jgi:hypothetical protein
LIITCRYQPKVINDDSGTKFNSLSETDHETPDDSGSANNFRNELSWVSEFDETGWLTSTNHDIGTTIDMLPRSDNGKSDDWWHLKDCGNEVSRKPE